MDEEQWIATITRRNLQKQLAREIVMRYGAIRSEWVCSCGAKLTWNSDYHKAQHYATKKHQQRLRKATLAL